MSRRRSSRALGFALGLASLAPPALGGARLDVSGEVLATAPRLVVRVAVANHGDAAAAAVDVTGELLGQRREARIATGVAPGRSGAVVLEFDAAGAMPGVHALTLLLEHPLPGTRDAAGNPPLASQRAWLLVALGASPGPAVRLQAQPARIDVRGLLEVSLASVDGAPHHVHLRAVTARGLRVDGEGSVLAVPASGVVTARLPLMRAGAPRGTRHGVLLVAETRDGPPLRTTVAVASVEVAPDPSLLPRLRRPLLVLALLLLAWALAAEAWRARRKA
ncbi:MAG: hypothetical protein ACM3PV_10705 [Betaproteobacteria bacterium]